jgi:hypothetical protein
MNLPAALLNPGGSYPGVSFDRDRRSSIQPDQKNASHCPSHRQRIKRHPETLRDRP